MKTQTSDDFNQWHTLPVDATFDRLNSTKDGLATPEALHRLQQFGPNRIQSVARKSPLRRLAEQFHNVLIYVLVASGVVTALLAHWVDTVVIFAVVLINGVIGFLQEGKAEKALDAIRSLLSQQAQVLRDGKLVSMPAEQLVRGDIVFLQSGDKVPADLRLFKLRDLQIEESMLTGESAPVAKAIAPVEEEVALGDRKCLAFSSTLVTYGQGFGVVTATGDASEIGRISGLLRTVHTLTTPLLKQIAVFARWLTVAILLLASITLVLGITLHSYSLEQMFIAAVGLAVAGIPEGLPAIMTITLAIGVQRMARRNAIIRRLPAVETLGSVSVICSDKTGTLTRNEMTVRSIVTASDDYSVSGVGYEPHGVITQDERIVQAEEQSALLELSRAALLCNDAEISSNNAEWSVQGDPTEGALIVLAQKAGMSKSATQSQFPRADTIPFESQNRFMATLHHDHNGHHFIYVKGAPERVMAMCQLQREQGEDVSLNAGYWEDKLANLANQGQRLLAVAFKALPAEKMELQHADVEQGLTLLGAFGIIDPARTEAIQAVKSCQEAGIRVKMITGDHAMTARAIGAQMNIGDGVAVMTGTELAKLDQRQVLGAVTATDIFARVSPEQKLQIVMALQESNEVVAMTGDGVNDAPALKRADVGIAMGRKGTEAAKEAAEMVLTDDNFVSIANAVEEGRTVYDNLKKSILFVLPTNGGEALMIVAAILMGVMLPVTPVQILWVNMITAVTLALTLAFEPAEANVMKRRPRDPTEPILSKFLIWRIVLVSLILVAGTFGLFLWERSQGASLEFARTVAVNTLVMFEIFYLFNARFLYESALTFKGLFGSRYVLIAIAMLLVFQMAFTYLPPMQKLFTTQSIDAYAWLRIVVVASSVLFLVEIEKAILRHLRER